MQVVHSNTYPAQRRSGFSLIEVLLAISILAILASAATPVLVSQLQTDTVSSTTDSIVSLLRRARMHAHAMDNDSAWGVSIQNDTAVLYAGESFATRSGDTNIAVSIPDAVTVSGDTDIHFNKSSGYTSIPQSLTVSARSGADEETIIINELGIVTQ